MSRGVRKNTMCWGTAEAESHMQEVGNEWQGRQVLGCAVLEGQHQDSGQFNKVMWSHGRVRLHEQICPLGRLTGQPCEGGMRAGGETEFKFMHKSRALRL